MSLCIKALASLSMAGPTVVTTEPSHAIAGVATLVFAAVFLGSILFVVIREIRSLEHEPKPVKDPHTFMVHGLGATMADGGEPISGDEDSKEQ